MKIALLLVLCALAAVARPSEETNASPLVRAQPTAAGVFVVRPDPRACPSPLCGGNWVSLANRARTGCSDRFLRPRCYAAVAVAAGTGQETTVPAQGLANGALESRQFGALGKLGVLTVSGSWAPVSSAPPVGAFLRLHDTGIRCVRAPCFSIRVSRLNSALRPTLLSALDLGPARSGSARRRAEVALRSEQGLLVAGRVVRTPEGGRFLHAGQVYLRAPTPRA